MTALWWRDSQFKRPAPAMPPLLSLEEMVARIEAARLEDAPARCPTCNVVTAAGSRRCCACNEVKPLSAFVLNKSKPHGRDYRCKPCYTASTRRWKLRAVLRRAS